MGYQIVDRIPDSRWDTRLWMEFQIVDEVPDRGKVPGIIPIWSLLPFDPTGWNETLMSHQSEILHSFIFHLVEEFRDTMAFCSSCNVSVSLFSRLLFALRKIHERKEVNRINKLPDALSQGKMDCVTSS